MGVFFPRWRGNHWSSHQANNDPTRSTLGPSDYDCPHAELQLEAHNTGNKGGGKARGKHNNQLVQSPQRYPSQRQQMSPMKSEAPVHRQETHEQRMKPGTIATKLKDGKVLCSDFNKGDCRVKAPQCPKGLHKCGKVSDKGRPCGMNFHGASTCRTK